MACNYESNTWYKNDKSATYLYFFIIQHVHSRKKIKLYHQLIFKSKKTF